MTRKSKRYIKATKRAIRAALVGKCVNGLEHLQVDHSALDVFVTDHTGHAVRPTLVIVRDRLTGMIVSYAIQS